MQPAYAERLEPILKASKVFLFSICFREVFSHYFLVLEKGDQTLKLDGFFGNQGWHKYHKETFSGKKCKQREKQKELRNTRFNNGTGGGILLPGHPIALLQIFEIHNFVTDP